MKIDPVTFDVLWEIESLIDPQYPIGEKAAAIHGITDDMVIYSPTLQEFVDVTLEGGLKGEITMIAHNFNFDAPALTQLGSVTRSICSLAEARQLRNMFPGLVDCKLQTLREYFGIKKNDAHQALADCDTTRLVLKKLVEASGRSLEQMASAKDRVVHTMPFGKHAGVLIVMLPKHYMRWCLDEMDMEKNLRESIQKAYDLKK